MDADKEEQKLLLFGIGGVQSSDCQQRRTVAGETSLSGWERDSRRQPLVHARGEVVTLRFTRRSMRRANESKPSQRTYVEID